MRIYGIVLTILLSLSAGACDSLKSGADVQVAHGNYILSSHILTGDEATSVRLGGKVFHISNNTITWDRNGSTPLNAGWGLLELVESPSSIVVNLDGVKVAELAK